MNDSARITTPRGFDHIDTWVFDLDNTLYSPDSDLWPQIDAKITQFIMDFHGLDGLAARALQKHYYKTYGTTLNGLMVEHQIDAVEFMQFVHDIDRSNLKPDKQLDLAIRSLPGRKLILTNGSVAHAEATAGQLGILANFSGIFDIAAAGFVPKPLQQAYDIFFRKLSVIPKRAAMFEDLAKNLAVPYQSGMTTVLVVPKAASADQRDDWEKLQTQESHIDWVTDDIAGFLQARMPAVERQLGEG